MLGRRFGLATLLVILPTFCTNAEVCDKVGGENWRPAPLAFSGALVDFLSSPWTFLLFAVLLAAWRMKGRWRGIILGLGALSALINGLLTWVLFDEYRAMHLVLQSALQEGCRSWPGDLASQLGSWLFTIALIWVGAGRSKDGNNAHGAPQP